MIIRIEPLCLRFEKAKFSLLTISINGKVNGFRLLAYQQCEGFQVKSLLAVSLESPFETNDKMLYIGVFYYTLSFHIKGKKIETESKA